MIKKLLLLTLISFSIPILAQNAGGLDTTFSNDGMTTIAIGATNDYPFATAVQADGKIVVAGFSDNNLDRNMAVARFNSNGTLDNTFDTDGKLTINIHSFDEAHAVVIQPDGKIVLGGLSGNSPDNKFTLVRLNSDGSFDTSFDSDGIAEIDAGIGNLSNGYCVALQSDKKIVIGGYVKITGGYAFGVARVDENGVLDNTFDTDGIAAVDMSAGFDYCSGIHVQSDGKIVLAGYISSPDYDFAAARLNTDGSLDTSFDTDGKLNTGFGTGTSDFTYASALQADGKLVINGYLGADLIIARYNLDGSLDNTFDTDGKLQIPVTGSNSFNAIAIQADGKIVSGGRIDNKFGLVRINTNGSIDNSFGTNGVVISWMGSNGGDMIYGLAIQADGKIIATGPSYMGNSNNDISVARYWDKTFVGIAKNQNISTVQAFPNPTENIITLNYTLHKECSVNITLYNVLGENVINVKDQYMTSGNYTDHINLENKIPAGYYTIIIRNNGVVTAIPVVKN